MILENHHLNLIKCLSSCQDLNMTINISSIFDSLQIQPDMTFQIASQHLINLYDKQKMSGNLVEKNKLNIVHILLHRNHSNCIHLQTIQNESLLVLQLFSIVP